ncbi:MAG: type VI secretion system baseplate subunit TssG [Bacteroidales bacterium]|nr:type VI secretion system baseplate subunit TssG [Bacteroidales bacterium]
MADRLWREPFAFDFFQAVRLLEWMQAASSPTGTGTKTVAEAVQFTVADTDAFPASSIADLVPPQENAPAQLKVNFFGLTGPLGVLPQHYTHLLMAQARIADNPERRAASAWFDLFNHRLIALFYEAWAKYRLPIAFERSHGDDRHDPITHAVLCLMGLGTPGLRERITIDADVAGDAHAQPESTQSSTQSSEPRSIRDLSLVRYAGLFAHAARSAAGLARLLSDYFATPVVVEQFRGYWVPLDRVNQTQIGNRGRNQILGESVVVGKRYWDAQGRFQLKLGPLEYGEFTRWLPDYEAGQNRILFLVELTRFYIRDGLDFDICLILQQSQVPACRLTRERPGSRLGWNSWLGHRHSDHHADDTVFSSWDIVRRYGSPRCSESEL